MWARVLVVGVVTYGTWWTWTFIVRPAWSPNGPKQFPYLIPFVGHAIGFSKDMNRTLTQARAPFAITVAGQVFYIITSPEDTNLFYRNTKTLTFVQFIEDSLTGLSVTPDGVRKAFPHLVLGRWHLLGINHSSIDKHLQTGALPKEAIIKSQDHTQTLSLWRWTRNTLIESISRGLFGDVIFELEPNLLEVFAIFDDNSWKMMRQYPKYAAPEVYDYVDKLNVMFQKYLQLPDEECKDRAWVLQGLESKFKEFNLEGRDLAFCFVMPFWVSNSNGYKLCFWILSFILQDDKLLAEIKDEIRAAISMDASAADTFLECRPKLVAVYNEVLRLGVSTASIRGISTDTAIDSVLLKAGNKVIFPYRQLHMHKDVWGSDVETFKAARFIDPQKDLSKSPSFRPFGGGNTLRTGRRVAMREVLYFVTLAIHRLNVKLPSGMNKSIDKVVDMFVQAVPTLGVLPPIPGKDTEVMVDVP